MGLLLMRADLLGGLAAQIFWPVHVEGGPVDGAVVEILRSDDASAKLVGLGAEVVADSPEQFADFLREDADRWARVVKESKIKFDF